MSTKASIVYSDEVHLYHDMEEEGDDVFLELHGDRTEYNVGRNSVIVRIPADIWEVIRHHGAVRFDMADKTDDDLMQLVLKEVDERIEKYNGVDKSNPDYASKQAWIAFIGSGTFGGADEPREKQIGLGMEHYKEMRAYQQEVRKRMSKLEVMEDE